MAPGGLLEQRISKEVTSAVIDTVNQVVAQEIKPPVHDTLDKVYTSYRDCVLTERHLAEKDLAASFQAERESAKTDFQEFLTDSTSASIDALDAALRSTKRKLDRKRDSVVVAIRTARRTSNPPTPIPLMPSLTSLGTLAENATPVGASKVAWTDLQNSRQPTTATDVPDPTHQPTPAPDVPAPTSPPPASTHPSAPSGSPAADATRDHTQHGGAHSGHPHRGGARPADPYASGFASGTRARYDNDSARSGGARADHNRPYCHSGPHDGFPGPSPTGSNSHNPTPMSNDTRSKSSRLYNCGQYGLDSDVPLGEEYLHSVGFTNSTVYSKIMRIHRIICRSWHNSLYNSYGPQKESILKSNAFSTRLLLEKFNAPLVVAWYKRLTSTCKAFRIGLVPFDAIQFKH